MAVFRTADREGYTRLDPGRYQWRCEEAESRYSKNGVDQIRLKLTVGNNSGTMTVYETLTFSEKAYFRVEHFMKSAGIYSGKDVDVVITPQVCEGLTGWCETVNEKNEETGKTYARIDTWLFAEEQRPHYLRTMSQEAPRRSYRQEEERRSFEPTGDDIPF